jgi:hypothetical protein
MINIIKEVAKRLEDAGIAYMFTGSTALNFYAVPRMTRDVAMISDAIKRHGMFNIIHFESIFKVDFIIRKDNPYRLEEFKRRKKIVFEGMEIYIVAPEDLILSKLFWIKEIPSELQMRDVKSILQAVKGLDFSYLDKWAEYLSVKEIYNQVRA